MNEQLVPGQNTAPSERGWHFTATDFLLGLLTFPLLVFLLMSVTSGMSEQLHTPRYRRRLMLLLLAVEAFAVGGIVWAVVR